MKQTMTARKDFYSQTLHICITSSSNCLKNWKKSWTLTRTKDVEFYLTWIVRMAADNGNWITVYTMSDEPG